ncbi:vWA domain-containing protein [Heyndrickxia sp. NPDC080065]|uniref:vWA domain-containing protein n=1 Tax=Heyndrickxia sp. NPDC080065 TaxID=3390568 RepID=UPI003CFDF8B0
MGLTNPIYLLLSIFIAGVIIFYLFRKQYEKQIVPSNLFWDQVMNEWQASPWIEKLQRNILLWMQLAILTLLMFALINPFWQTKGIGSDHLIIIVDTSASMSAIHNGQSRFQSAKNELISMIDQINGQDVTLISAGNDAKVEIKNETNQSLLKAKINQLSISYQACNIDKAIRLAESMAEKNNSSIHIYSDSVTKESIPQIRQKLPIHVHNIGSEGTNLSLQSFGVAKRNQKIVGAGLIENQSKEDQQVQFQIRNEDNVLFTKVVLIPGGSQKLVNVPSLPQKDYYVASIDVKDDYPIDNTRTAVYSPPLSKIYAVGDVNPFLIKGFETIGVHVTQVSMNDWKEEPEDGIVLMEGVPLTKWIKSPSMIINPNKGKESNIKHQITTKDDPLLQYVDFENTFIQKGSTMNQTTLQTIAQSGDVPLIGKGEQNGKRVVCVNFSIEDSDWPLKPGFPIFLYQSFQWLSDQQNFKGFFTPDEKKWMTTDTNSNWKIYDESGKFIRSFQLEKESFVAPNKPGLYQITAGDHSMYMAVVLDESEQSIPVKPSFVLNQLKPGAKGNIKSTPYSFIWFWITITAFIILFIEWEVYRRANRR